jgi:hypothetical protein
VSKDDFIFEGFDPANTTPVPDVFFDVLLPRLNEAQIKVMMYIIRRTLGFKKSSDAISLKQFRHGITTRDGRQLDQGCGLKNFTTITKALQSLEEMGCIESEKKKTTNGDSATTVYRVRFRGTTANVVPTTPNVGRVLRQTEDRTTPNGGRVLRQTEPQETVLQETVLQETERQENPTIEQEPRTSSQHEAALSPSLSQKSVIDYDLFDELCRKKGYAADFRVPRNDKNNTALQELKSQGATPEQVEYVFNDLWDDRDPFWRQHRGKPSTVASQFTARIWKMTAPAQKRQTLTGTTNYTEDRIGKPAQEAQPTPILPSVKPVPQPTTSEKSSSKITSTKGVVGLRRSNHG